MTCGLAGRSVLGLFVASPCGSGCEGFGSAPLLTTLQFHRIHDTTDVVLDGHGDDFLVGIWKLVSVAGRYDVGYSNSSHRFDRKLHIRQKFEGLAMCVLANSEPNSLRLEHRTSDAASLTHPRNSLNYFNYHFTATSTRDRVYQVIGIIHLFIRAVYP